jgi:uncharacterized integral membrane protein
MHIFAQFGTSTAVVLDGKRPIGYSRRMLLQQRVSPVNSFTIDHKGVNMITLIIVIIAVSVMVIFSVQNAAPVAVTFLSGKFEASLSVIVLLAVFIGTLIGAS